MSSAYKTGLIHRNMQNGCFTPCVWGPLNAISRFFWWHFENWCHGSTKTFIRYITKNLIATDLYVEICRITSLSNLWLAERWEYQESRRGSHQSFGHGWMLQYNHFALRQILNLTSLNKLCDCVIYLLKTTRTACQQDNELQIKYIL